MNFGLKSLPRPFVSRFTLHPTILRSSKLKLIISLSDKYVKSKTVFWQDAQNRPFSTGVNRYHVVNRKVNNKTLVRA